MKLDTDYIKDRVTATESGCWNWNLCVDYSGYGKATVNKRCYLAHRLSYELFIGEIPNGMDIDHICFNPACCNPQHLRVLDRFENRRLQRSALKTECINGHKLEGENVYIKNSSGNRSCKKCNLESVKRYKERKAA